MHTLSTILCGGLLLGQALAHSWIEQMVNIDSNGKYVGDYGYPRGFVDKGIPGFDQQDDLWLLPANSANRIAINASDYMCNPRQRTQNQTENYPRLQVSPGGYFAMRYSENGHISQPNQLPGKPEKAGTVFVFGTTQPKDDEKIVDVMKWTTDGSGGDKRGILVSAQTFDDGRCHEINPGNPIADARMAKFPNYAQGQAGDGTGNFPLMCESDMALPNGTQTGQTYTLYWVWQWPTAPGTPAIPNGKDEYYTTCMDVDVVNPSKQMKTFKVVHSIQQQDARTGAVSNFASRTAITSHPIKGEISTAIFGSAGGANATVSQSSNVAQATTTTAAQNSGAALSTASGPSSSVNIPTITNQPGLSPSQSSGGGDDAVTVTVTEHVTVTAPLSIQTIAARSAALKEDAHAHTTAHMFRHGSAKFRGRLI